MKIIKYLFLLILIALSGLAAYIALQDGEIEISKSQKIKAPSELVFNQVADFKHWPEWSQLYQLSPNTEVNPSSNLEEASLEWKIDSLSLQGVITNQDIIKISSITQSIHIEKKMEKTDLTANWTFFKEADTTTIDLQLAGNINFWAKAKRLLGKQNPAKILDSKVEKSLLNLKKNIDEEMSVFSINVDGVKTNPETTYIYKSFSASNDPAYLSKKRTETLKILHDYLQNQHAESEASGMMLFNHIDKPRSNVIVSVGLSVSSALPDPDEETGLSLGEIPEQKIIKGTLKGDYANIAKLWEALMVYMKKNKLEQDEDFPAYEVYKITQEDSENPAEWITELIIPIREKTSSLRSQWQLEQEETEEEVLEQI